jgi:hypothetical protein
MLVLHERRQTWKKIRSWQQFEQKYLLAHHHAHFYMHMIRV